MIRCSPAARRGLALHLPRLHTPAQARIHHCLPPNPWSVHPPTVRLPTSSGHHQEVCVPGLWCREVEAPEDSSIGILPRATPDHASAPPRVTCLLMGTQEAFSPHACVASPVPYHPTFFGGANSSEPFQCPRLPLPRAWNTPTKPPKVQGKDEATLTSCPRPTYTPLPSGEPILPQPAARVLPLGYLASPTWDLVLRDLGALHPTGCRVLPPHLSP
jgi:hypothetical protein